MKRPACVAVLAAAILSFGGPAANATDCPACDGGGVDGGYSETGSNVHTLGRPYMKQLQAKAGRISFPSPKGPFFKYASTGLCGGARPDNDTDTACGADTRCEGNTPAQGQGPPLTVWEARIDKDGKPVDDQDKPIAALEWRRLGVTCLPEMVPGAQPRLTMAQITAAFHDTDFAVASVNIQPEGNITLATLPTYFQVVWPLKGFQPNEVDAVDPARMSGFRVDIRPRLEAVVYVYGDGSSSKRTVSLGGPYPDGDIRHEYARGGDYQVRADVTYGGQYRVNGSQWIGIPGNLTIQGTPVTLTVMTAKARLVNH
jgi:hypothetical protein